MPLTSQQWAVFNSVLDYLTTKLDELSMSDAWTAYVAFATPAGHYIPTDADFAAWALLAATDPVPAEYTAFFKGLSEFYGYYHNSTL